MKRHNSLIPLSKFHRSVLFLALVTKKNAPDVKGYPTTLEGKKDYALSFYERQLRDHFLLEEQKLFPAILGKNHDLDQLVDQIMLEHQKLKALFDKLANSNDLEYDLDQLGVTLEKHIRREERELFQQVQKILTEEELDQLASIYM